MKKGQSKDQKMNGSVDTLQAVVSFVQMNDEQRGDER